MTAYEFHVHDEEHGDTLVGILPERRQSRDRITDQSVINWARTILGDAISPRFDRIYFVRVEV